MRPPNEVGANAYEFGIREDILKEHRISLMLQDHIYNRVTSELVINPSGRIESSIGTANKLRMRTMMSTQRSYALLSYYIFTMRL